MRSHPSQRLEALSFGMGIIKCDLQQSERCIAVPHRPHSRTTEEGRAAHKNNDRHPSFVLPSFCPPYDPAETGRTVRRAPPTRQAFPQNCDPRHNTPITLLQQQRHLALQLKRSTGMLQTRRNIAGVTLKVGTRSQPEYQQRQSR